MLLGTAIKEFNNIIATKAGNTYRAYVAWVESTATAKPAKCASWQELGKIIARLKQFVSSIPSPSIFLKFYTSDANAAEICVSFGAIKENKNTFTQAERSSRAICPGIVVQT